MWGTRCRQGLVWAAFLFLLAARPAGAQQTLKIGVGSSLFRDTPPTLIEMVSRPLIALMEAQTGASGKMVVDDVETLARKLKENHLQLSVFHGFEFAWVRRQHPALKPLVIVVARHTRLHAYLIVRQNCSAKCCADLKGKPLALPVISRGQLHLYLERRCPSAESDPRRFFSEVQRPVDADNALDDVLDGVAEVALVEQAGWDDFQKQKPGRAAKLKVLHQSETFPASVIAYHPGSLDETMVKRLREGLLTAERSERGKELLNMCRITGFAEVPDDYEKLLADILKAYPPPKAK